VASDHIFNAREKALIVVLWVVIPYSCLLPPLKMEAAGLGSSRWPQ